MTNLKKQGSAARIASMIKRNVDLWYANTISYERFGQRQSRLWTLAQSFGVDDEVIEIVRPRMR